MHKTTFTGKTNRKLQDSWQKEFSWLLYNASDNKLLWKNSGKNICLAMLGTFRSDI
jgi:hypothetical protein